MIQMVNDQQATYLILLVYDPSVNTSPFDYSAKILHETIRYIGQSKPS